VGGDGLHEQKVRRSFHHKVVHSDEEVLGNVVAKRGLQREQGVAVGRENVGCRDRPRVPALIFNKPRAFKVVRLDHEGRVRRVDDLTPLCEALFNEAQKVLLGLCMKA